MVPFLRQAAVHYFKAGDIQNLCFVFPNRRSMVFFKKYLGECVRESGTPLPAPRMFTINDFFASVYGSKPSEKLRLTVELYECYCQLYKDPEPLDRFIFWGDIILSDFDDTDKYLVSPERLFTNVAQFKGMMDDFSYLSEAQRNAINSFLSHFRDASGPVPVDGNGVKARFVRLWNILLPLYKAFGKRLREKGMAYEGMVYRDLASRLMDGGESVVDLLSRVFPDVSGYVFVGLNALNECERTVLRKMRDARIARFVWDYVTPEIMNSHNKSSFFMRRNMEEFPQDFTVTAAGMPEISVISVPSSTGQAKLAPWILDGISGDPVETAFILPDETLLTPLLNSIPPRFDSINVTMGCPLSTSAVYSLVQTLGQMQLKIRRKEDKLLFYHRQVGEVFSSGLFTALISEQEAQAVARIKAAGRYYIPAQELRCGPVMEKFFTEADNLGEYLADIVGMIGRSLSESGNNLLELDFAKRLHNQLVILSGIKLDVQPATWLRVLDSLVSLISVPFKGEPLRGLQIMGPLETRALDFRNIVIMSAGEGMFPRRSVSVSFIPPELRKGFGLPTYEFQDAVWAYYFYRLLQRAEKLWLIYDSRTEGLHSGEESRYIKQLEYHFGVKLNRYVASETVFPVQPEGDIPKTAEDVEIIRQRELSASALQNYLMCQAKFYFQVVKQMEVSEEVAESLDAGMLGNVFHHVMQRLYSGHEKVYPADIAGFLKDDDLLRKIVREEILREMNSFELAGRNVVLAEVILDYVRSALRHDASLLASEGSQGYFSILGLEERFRSQFEGFRIKGFVDRIDSYRSGEVRIVDYKTGKVEESDILINDDNAASVADKLFGEANKGRPKIALQLFLYGVLLENSGRFAGSRLVNSIYSTSRLYTGPLPDMPQNALFNSIVKDSLKEMLQEMVDLDKPFRRTADPDTCKLCDFKDICGR